MSFDKKIREKLVNHIPKYDSGAWESFSKLLPAPWYTTLFTTNLGWTVSGLSTAALLFTAYLLNTKTERLNGEISTLTNQIELQKEEVKQQNLSGLEKVDTVYITREVDKYIRVERPEQASFQEGLEKGYANASNDVAYLQNELDKLRKENLALNSELSIETQKNLETNRKVENSETAIAQSPANKNDFTANKNAENKEIATDDVRSKQKQKTLINDNNQAPVENKNSLTTDEETLVADISEQELKKAYIENLDKEIKQEDQIASTERTDPEKPKKKINWPKMRFGINSDYLGLKVLATGPAAEVFISDKISFNASAIFSGQVETKHPLAKDFNKFTGKEFNKEFHDFVNQQSELIEDISIKTSFIKLPLYFNYYINTWSRFNFLISAGTKLDLSVYQNVDYASGPLGQQVQNRFEAKAKPKTFNNLFYGMGMQYKYGNFVGQITPYFDFTFRQADYFTPAKNFGVNASLKFEFGK
ncbi:hypothetical protein [Arcticibacterium luteifluviistationis]|uniref:Outer membrane protein beta-barrel domain-containing protein n=1 Tax=Arcticibacterium luteifluviistationis TaxID=1784714 RepID=A0A2Z4GEA7_9BACT|nr:hypothetical protein [Arcticibacterium luteifluviistationis]AWV99586.1 hypothetical protein DJ013_15980 [Arcticibacterium luteifluviistationis]